MGYVSVAYLMIIVDETVQVDGCDKTRREGHEQSTDGRLEGRWDMRQKEERLFQRQ